MIRDWLSKFFSPRAETYRQDGTWLSDWLRGGQDADSGISVTEKTGIKNATVWKCVNWRANQVGMLPKKINERIEVQGRLAQRPAPLHPLYRIVHTNPNPLMSSKQYFGLVSADLHLWGNSYAYIQRGVNTGRLQNLWRLTPDRVVPQAVPGGGIRYKVSDDKGSFVYFLPDEILHIPGLGFDGVQGYSPIRMMMQTLGWNMAAQRYGAQFFKHASRPSGIVSLTGPVKPEAMKVIEDNLSKAGKEAGKLLLIQGALEYKPLTMPQDEAQFVETLQHQEEDIVGIMGVPQHKVQILRRSTNNNIEHQGIEAVTDCIQPLCVDIEQAFNLQLLSDAPSSGRGGGTERERFFMECELKALLRGDIAAQTTHIKDMIASGVYSPNDGRDYLGQTPYAGGDVYVVNRALGPVETIDEWSKVSQNNPPAKDAETEPEKKKAADRVVVAMFKSGVGRTLARKGDRAKSVAAVFGEFLEALGFDADFAGEYLGAMARRSESWAEAEAGSIAESEVTRALDALKGRQS